MNTTSIPFSVLSFVFSLMLAYSVNSYSDSRHEQSQLVNINTASAETIAKTLHGIGLKKAEAIVEYREQYGEFKYIEELSSVKGIGKSTLAKNKHLVVLEE